MEQYLLISPPGGSEWIFLVLVMILVVASAGIYFIPTYIAYKKDKKNKLPILLINLFAGWTLIGWVGALVWAVSQEKPDLVIENHLSYQNPQQIAGNQSSTESTSNLSDQLEKLHSLMEKGVLSKEEFEDQKRKLLAKLSNTP